MNAEGNGSRPRGWTRAGVLRAVAGAGAAVAGGAAIGAHGGASAAPSKEMDVEILGLFLLLEQVQERFYREALQQLDLSSDLRSFASAVSAQERAHVAFLERRLDGRGRGRPESDFGDALSSPESFRAAAVDLEETAVGAYVGQAANLTARVVAPIATLVSVEARQAAWIRDLDGISPAPRAADPARDAQDVLRHLRTRGFIR